MTENKVHFKVIFKKKEGDDSKSYLYIRITINRIPTEMRVPNHQIEEKHWDSKKNDVSKKCLSYWTIKRDISDMIAKMEQVVMEFNQKQQIIKYNDLKAIFAPTPSASKSKLLFTDFFEQEYSKRNDITQKTKNIYKRTLKKLKDYHPEPITFEKIDFAFIQGFGYYLTEKGCNANYKSALESKMIWMLGQALEMKLIDANPYDSKKYKKDYCEPKRVALSRSEVERLEKLNFTPKQKSFQLSYDIYLFACYTGLRISDILTLRPEHFTIEGDKVFLKKIMEKSQIDKSVTLKLHELPFRNPIPLLLKYLANKESFVFPRITDITVNKKLKFIAELAEINKNLSMHTGRRTFAVNTYHEDKDILKLKHYLAHSSLEDTMKYVDLYNEMF